MTKVNWLRVQHLLEKFSKEFLKENYDMELGIPIELSGRMKKSYGMFWHSNPRTPKKSIKITMSKNYIEHQLWETVLQTMKHELIHYALYEKDLPYKDGHPVFEAEISKHESHSTGTVKYRGKVVSYSCLECEQEFIRRRRLNHDGAYSLTGCCNSKLRYNGTKII